MGAGEERTDLAGLGGAQLARSDVVDEEPVALLGGDTTGRGVRLGEVALALEHRHVVAHRRGRHPDLAGRSDMGGPHGLRGLDVGLDHGAQDGGLPVVEHDWHSVYASANAEPTERRVVPLMAEGR